MKNKELMMEEKLETMKKILKQLEIQNEILKDISRKCTAINSMQI